MEQNKLSKLLKCSKKDQITRAYLLFLVHNPKLTGRTTLRGAYIELIFKLDLSFYYRPKSAPSSVIVGENYDLLGEDRQTHIHIHAIIHTDIQIDGQIYIFLNLTKSI